jgi:hypothetical protein
MILYYDNKNIYLFISSPLSVALWDMNSYSSYFREEVVLKVIEFMDEFAVKKVLQEMPERGIVIIIVRLN